MSERKRSVLSRHGEHDLAERGEFPERAQSTQDPTEAVATGRAGNDEPTHHPEGGKGATKRPYYKDQVRTNVARPIHAAVPPHTQQDEAVQEDTALTNCADEKAVLFGGPRNKDQARSVAPPTLPMQRPVQAPKVEFIAGPARVARGSDSSITSEPSDQLPPASATRDPSLIHAVLVESAVVQADPLIVENKSRSRSLFWALFIAVVLAVAGVTGVCSDGSCGRRSDASSPNNSTTNVPTEVTTIGRPSEESTVNASSVTPVQNCFLDFNMECFLGGDSISSGQSCDLPVPNDVAEPCYYQPYTATMLFTGGPCGQSSNVENLNFTCNDFNGGPPTQESEKVYIEVTDDNGFGPILFMGIVSVGELYVLGNNGQPFGDFQRIIVHSLNRTQFLQSVNFSLGCSTSNPVELNGHFGASQFVEFINDVQGYISALPSLSPEREVRILVSIIVAVAEQHVTLNTLSVLSSFGAGEYNLTNQVAGEEIHSGSTATVVFTETIDFSERKSYTIVYYFEAITNPGGSFCNGTGIESFVAGYDGWSRKN